MAEIYVRRAQIIALKTHHLESWQDRMECQSRACIHSVSGSQQMKFYYCAISEEAECNISLQRIMVQYKIVSSAEADTVEKAGRCSRKAFRMRRHGIPLQYRCPYLNRATEVPSTSFNCVILMLTLWPFPPSPSFREADVTVNVLV